MKTLSDLIVGAVVLLAACHVVAAEPVSYLSPVLDENGALTGFESASCEDYTSVVATDEPLRLDAGWYVVEGTNTFTEGVEILGDVKLILKDAASFRACPTNETGRAGVHVGVEGKLTVYAQSADETTMGELIAFGGACCAGIGGNDGEAGHDIVINGGRVMAKGGIGDASTGTGATPRGGAAIGGGDRGDGYNLVVSGGRVEALSLAAGAGIGGGGRGCGHEILVRGGTVSFSKDAASSHLGSGHGGATPYGIYIGGGSVLTITNKVGCIVRDRLLNAVYPVTIEGLADGPATVKGLSNYGAHDLTAVDGKLMLWLPAGAHSFTVNGVSKTVTVTGQGEAAHDPVAYRVPTIVGGRVTGYTTETSTNYGVIDAFTSKRRLAAGWYVASGEFVSDQPLEFLGDAHLILRDGARLTVAGVKVAANGSISVYAQSEDSQLMGALVSTGGNGVPGLGGGAVTINGGRITASGGNGAAGVGSDGMVVAVNGGIVRAEGGTGAAADIGGTVGIFDGTVSAAVIGEAGRVASIAGGSVCGNPVGNVGTFCVTLVGGWADDVKIEVSGVGDYATHAVYAMDRRISLWLPNGTYEITANYLTADVTVVGGPVTKTGSIAYLDPVFDADGATTNFVTKYRTDYFYYENANLSGKQLAGGWHVIAGNCTIDKNASLSTGGDVKLILKDGASLNKTESDKHRGFIVQTGSLTVYAQSTNEKTMGAMTISGGDYCAAIGTGDPDDGHDNKPITINGGKITATGGNYAAGIGSSKKGNASNITINGGIVTATGGENGAGIGGGEGKDRVGGNASKIYINGGKVTATGGEKGAGIGGGLNGAGYDIYIRGGEVRATCPKHAAGIGGGDNSDGYNIFISGGCVNAICYDKGGAGIGAGGNGDGGVGHDITISGGTVYAQGDENGDSIGSAKGGNPPYKIVFTGGSIRPCNDDFGSSWPTDGKDNKVYRVTVPDLHGRCTVSGLGDYGTKDLDTYDDKLYLWLPDGTHEFYVNGLKYLAEVKGKAVNAERMVEGGVPYLAYDESSDTFSRAEASNCCLVTSSDTEWGKDGKTTWYLADGKVTVDHTVNVKGHVNLILKDACALAVNGGLAGTEERRGAAIRQTGTSSSFTVYAQTTNRVEMGVLTANAAKFGAGIGGGDPSGSYALKEYDPYQGCYVTVRTFESGHNEYGRNITINGGAVFANGGLGGAGIGGGQDYAGENITINGGSVTAKGGRRGGAGIGGGGSDTSKNEYTYGDAGNIRITGGLVTAEGGDMDFAENEGRSAFDSWFSTVYEIWGHGTDIGGGGSYTREEARNNTPLASVACCIPYVGYFITAELYILDAVMQYTDEYTGGGECRDVYITGGTVEAVLVGGENQQVFKLTGGSLRGSMFGTPPLNDAGRQVYLVNLRMTEEQAATLKVPGYGVRDILPSQECGYVCLWLPAGYQEIAFDGVRYALVINDSGDFSLSKLGNDLNVMVNGVKVTDGEFLTGCSYSSSDQTLRITGTDHPYVLSGAEDNGRLKIVVEGATDLVFSNLVLTASALSGAPVTFRSGVSQVELKGQANYFGCHYMKDDKVVLGSDCAIVVEPSANVTFLGEGPLTAVAGASAAAIGGSAGKLCGGITIAGGRLRVCGGEDAAAIGTGSGAGPTTGTFVEAGPIVVRGGWISALGTAAYCDLGCGKYPEGDHQGKYVNVPVTVAGGTLDLAAIRGTTRATAPSIDPAELIGWWATNDHVVVDGGVFRGQIGRGGGSVNYALNSRGELVWSNLGSPCYTGTSAGEEITNLVVSSGAYRMHDACAIDGYLYLWLPTNATLGVSHPDGVRDMTGFQVNGRDFAWGEGDGWRYDPSASLLTLDAYLYYRLHENDHRRTRDLRIAAVTNVTVTLDGVCLRSTGGAPLEVAADRSLSIGVLVSNALLSATAGCPGIDLKAGASVFIKKYDDPSAPEGPVLEVAGGTGAPGVGTLANADTGIHIGGATVLATGGSGAAGLGNGTAGGRVPTVKIVGGRVFADRIGCGTSGGTGGGIVIEGGSVETEVLGTMAEDADLTPITIIGGSVAAKTWSPQPVEASGLLYVHDTLIGYPWAGPASVVGLGDYGTNDLYAAADGNLHVWLSASYDAKRIYIDDVGEVPLEVLTSHAGGRAFASVDPANLREDYTKDVAELVAANALVVRPNEDVEKVVGPLAYGSYFKVTPQPTGVGENYTLDVDLTEETRRKICEDIEDALPALVETVTNAVPTTSVNTLAGLYYGIAGATNVVEVKASVVPADETKLGDGNPVELKGKRPEGVTDRAFYSIRAAARP